MFEITSKMSSKTTMTQICMGDVCGFCNNSLEKKEGVTFYDRNWYHGECWELFENKLEETN